MTTYSSSTAMLPSDFTSARPGRPAVWTTGTLRHVIAALGGAPVVVTVDRQTGHTLVNAWLVAAFDGGPGRGPRLTVDIELPGGELQRTHYGSLDIGVIVPLHSGPGVEGAKWRALDAMRREGSAALALARPAAEASGKAGTWGAWTSVPLADAVLVSYAPHTGNPFYADRWGRHFATSVALSALAVPAAEEDEEDFGCPGHESLSGAHMGEAVYCDGSCR